MSGSQRFAGRTALVTGSSRGLGFLIARELAERGCRVMLCARGAEGLAAAEETLHRRGADVATLACDVTASDAPQLLLDAVHDRFGHLDVLVNNAGIIQVGPMSTFQEEDFREAMEAMFFSPLRLAYAALPDLRASAAGTLVSISSIGGRIAPPHLLPYAAAKFAHAGLSEGLRAEITGSGVTVTTVFPGLMRTGSHTAARFQGRPGAEYGWFAAAASLPVLSMNAERAARAIVRAAERRRPELVLTPAAKAAVRLKGIAPVTTARLLSTAGRFLPSPGKRPRRDVAGTEAARHAKLPRWVTALGDRAGRQYGEPRADRH
ncbi:SDR family NAD(P)-dependent oxidoreductase [Streptomyces xanthochromogenes]|uniref:SDR family NAD(P)-dependent oxidoreductase n=1 Tax=Streptomyces xanthochromogenes TaxID=67384 RepID=UPI00381A236C